MYSLHATVSSHLCHGTFSHCSVDDAKWRRLPKREKRKRWLKFSIEFFRSNPIPKYSSLISVFQLTEQWPEKGHSNRQLWCKIPEITALASGISFKTPCVHSSVCVPVSVILFRFVSYTRAEKEGKFVDNHIPSPTKAFRLLCRNWKEHTHRLRVSYYTREAVTQGKRRAIWGQELEQYKYSAENQQIITMNRPFNGQKKINLPFSFV